VVNGGLIDPNYRAVTSAADHVTQVGATCLWSENMTIRKTTTRLVTTEQTTNQQGLFAGTVRLNISRTLESSSNIAISTKRLIALARLMSLPIV